jgi:DNA polymerase IV (archaeal DinB-like DNA polymerase)
MDSMIISIGYLLSREEQETWTGKVIVCVDLNAFYPSCEELRDNNLVGKPHAVIMTDQREGEINRGVVSSCSYEARKYGIRSAMPLSQATSLCPNLILIPVDISYYSQVSKKVMEILEQFADVLEQASIDEAFLECTLKRAQIEPEDYAMQIKNAIKEECGLLCSIGVTTTKSSAKLASDYRKPDGLTVVYPYNLTKFLEPLEVGLVAGIGPKTQDRLKEMGIVTLGQLAAMDVSKLVNKFGANGAWMWNVANGKDDEPVVVRGDHISLSTENTLNRHTSDKVKIAKFLNELVDEIYERARRGDYLYRTIGVKLVRADFTIETRETTFQDFQNSKESIASAINTVLDRFSFSEDQPAVRKVGIKLSNLIRGSDLTQARAVQRTIPEYF